MATREQSTKALLSKVDSQIAQLETAYRKSLNAQTVDPELKVDIKNICENLRSILDYVASDIREQCCPTAKSSSRYYFPILPDKRTFDTRVDEWFPGLRRAAPAVVATLEAAQPFQSGQEWLGQFNRLNNENKHGDLVEQTRVETPQTRVSSPGGGQVSWGSGVTFGEGVSIMGVPVDPKTQLPVPNSSLKTERLIWVDFRFADIDASALGLLKQARAGIAAIETDVRSVL